MRESVKEKVKEQTKDPSTKSLRFVSGIPKTCHNPLCRSDFSPKRKDQRFCGRNCKGAFFKVCTSDIGSLFQRGSGGRDGGCGLEADERAK